MKNYWLIGGAVLLVISIIGVLISFTSPAESTANQPTKVLNYQQSGSFDYTVMAKPSFFYGGQPAASPEPSPQIPVKFIQSFNLTYDYQPASGTSGQSLEINAILENPGNWTKTINLVPSGPVTSSISIPVDLKNFQDLADTIEKEIGTSSSTHNLTIEAVVSGGNGPQFVQDLPIKMTGTFIKIGDNLTSATGSGQGRFDYQVKLSDNDLFGAVTLTPPVSVQSAPDVSLGPSDVILTKFIDTLKVSYVYQLTSDKPLRQVQEQITVDAVIGSANSWSKTYNLVPATAETDNFTISFPVDLNQYSEIYNTIQQEIGVGASTESLALQVTTHLTAQSDQGPIDKTYTQSIQTDLQSGILTWTGDLKKAEPDAIEASLPVTTAAKMWMIPVTWIRIISTVVFIIVLAILGIYLLAFRSRTGAPTAAESQARQISQKYKELIVEVSEKPEFKPEQTVLPLDSLQDLVKVAQGLLKPVHHNVENGSHIYWVYDDSIRYQYLLIDGKTGKDIKASEDEARNQSPSDKQV